MISKNKRDAPITFTSTCGRPGCIYNLVSHWSMFNMNSVAQLRSCDCRIGYILNVTREIDNFYPGSFEYMNIRLYDVPQSELLKHWDNTYKFIKRAEWVSPQQPAQYPTTYWPLVTSINWIPDLVLISGDIFIIVLFLCRRNHSKVLVHCKMGISRSASTVSTVHTLSVTETGS